MRILIVISSPTPATNEFENVWRMCPQSRELDTDRLAIAGWDWEIFVLNGLAQKYCRDKWNYETLNEEITDIIHQHGSPAVSILLHDDDDELNSLREQLSLPETATTRFRRYSSLSGTFYRDIVKPFSTGASDDLFDKIWEMKIEKDRDDHEISYTLCFLKHKLEKILAKLGGIVEAASLDIPRLESFKKLDDRLELCRYKYAMIEKSVAEYGLDGLCNVPKMIDNIMLMSKEVQNSNSNPQHRIKLARQCLEATDTVKNLFEKAWEVSHERKMRSDHR